MDRFGPTGKVSNGGPLFAVRPEWILVEWIAPHGYNVFPSKWRKFTRGHHLVLRKSRTRSRTHVRIQRSLLVTQFKITRQLLWKCKSRLLKEVTGNETLEEIFINSNARIYRLMTVIITFTKYLSVRLRRPHANAGIVEKICLESLSI